MFERSGRPGRSMTPESDETRYSPRRQQYAPQTTNSETARFDTGTTIVGIMASDGVVLGADQRMSLGGRFTANKDVQKVERVHPRAALAISGSVGPAQDVVRSLRASADLYEARRGTPMSMRALSRTAADLVRGKPMQPILAGVDDGGEWVFELDGGGSVLDDAYTAGGSGMAVAYGVLERRFDADLDVEAAGTLAVDAILAASERDNASGDGVTTATITAEGVEIAVRDEKEAM